MSQQSMFAQFQKAKAFVRFDELYAPVLPRLRSVVMARQEPITNGFYASLAKDPEAAAILVGRVDKLVQTHAIWMDQLFGGSYGEEYFNNRYQIGLVHVNAKVAPYFVEVIVSYLRIEMSRAILEADAADVIGVQAILALLDLEQMIINGAYSDDRNSRLSQVTGISASLLENLMSFKPASK